jgi:hypothetical protein
MGAPDGSWRKRHHPCDHALRALERDQIVRGSPGGSPTSSSRIRSEVGPACGRRADTSSLSEVDAVVVGRCTPAPRAPRCSHGWRGVGPIGEVGVLAVGEVGGSKMVAQNMAAS